ncbi:hypothetical protein BDF20DRAFT_831337 [Mycotypha africana]|uniref:uncharacterized protein n=1 Tax=Mycotypha africana TaxID=64632 RepID=UPI00230048DE|nr:uncharacterized protein BDF20DRAFT_831337 [Mycotypha africana]KAI8991280.1 hypothetical protein BDF20DRAFT_831337 [Mycotypha africana]
MCVKGSINGIGFDQEHRVVLQYYPPTLQPLNLFISSFHMIKKIQVGRYEIITASKHESGRYQSRNITETVTQFKVATDLRHVTVAALQRQFPDLANVLEPNLTSYGPEYTLDQNKSLPVYIQTCQTGRGTGTEQTLVSSESSVLDEFQASLRARHEAVMF